ncbi:MAG: hypothetical protein WDO24_05755 [Pseudomonadota bacterium]
MTAQITELRALEIFSNVPDGCRLHLMSDDRHDPHLREGEWAVVDPSDRDLVSGELYQIQWKSGTERLAIMQVTRRLRHGVDGIWLTPLRKPVFLPNGDLDWSKPIHMSDGPLKPEFLPEYLRGRVIGIYQATAALALPAPGQRRR